MHSNNGYQMVNGHPRTCGRQRKDPDGRKRQHVSASIPATANDVLQDWKRRRGEEIVGTRMGDVLTKLIHFSKDKGFNPLD